MQRYFDSVLILSFTLNPSAFLLGFGTKEPCYSPSDCGATATSCLDSLCRYPEPLGPAMTSCSFAYDCQPNEDCVGGKCKAQSSGKHLTGQVCTFDRDCPETHRCDRMKLTCYEGGKQHKTGITCVFNYQCPSGYYCDQMTCYEGGPAHSQQVCVMDDQCDKGQVCKNMTCTQE